MARVSSMKTATDNAAMSFLAFSESSGLLCDDMLRSFVKMWQNYFVHLRQ